MESDDEIIPITMTENEWAVIALAYMEARFRPESIDVYYASIDEGKSQADAVYDAIRNDAVNEILAQLVEPISPEAGNPPTNQHNTEGNQHGRII